MFQSLNEIKNYFRNTFVIDTAEHLIKTIEERKIYNEIDGKLYIGAIGGGVPFTTLTYETDTMEFIKSDKKMIIVSMNTSCNGEPDNPRQFTIEKHNEKWFLNDKFIEFF